MQKNKKKSKRSNRRKGKKEREDGYLPQRVSKGFPPDIKSNPIFNRVIRYRVATAFQDKNFNMSQIHAFMLWVTNASSAAFTVVNAVRIRRIVIYSVPTANFGATINEISFRWINLGNFESTITSRGTLSDPAKIVVQPPRNSLIDRAFDVNDPEISTSIANINAPVESLIDFHIQYTLLDGAGSANTLTANATFTGLAPVSISSGTLIPDGVTNTVTSTST
jgi:hypothetical protein